MNDAAEGILRIPRTPRGCVGRSESSSSSQRLCPDWERERSHLARNTAQIAGLREQASWAIQQVDSESIE